MSACWRLSPFTTPRLRNASNIAAFCELKTEITNSSFSSEGRTSLGSEITLIRMIRVGSITPSSALSAAPAPEYCWDALEGSTSGSAVLPQLRASDSWSSFWLGLSPHRCLRAQEVCRKAPHLSQVWPSIPTVIFFEQVTQMRPVICTAALWPETDVRCASSLRTARRSSEPEPSPRRSRSHFTGSPESLANSNGSQQGAEHQAGWRQSSPRPARPTPIRRTCVA